MSCDDDTAEMLRRAGHKLTPQRLLIVRTLRHAEGHISASQILDRVREPFPFVDVSTVYRTLDVLRRMRLATATDVGTGDAVFEWRPEDPHHHLICTSCNQTIDLPHAYFEPLAEQLDHDYGFEANLDHFAVFGICRQCQLPERIP